MKHVTANRPDLLLFLTCAVACAGAVGACAAKGESGSPGGNGTGSGGSSGNPGTGGSGQQTGAGGTGGQSSEPVDARPDYVDAPVRPDAPFTMMGISACQKMQMAAFTPVMSQAVFSVLPPPVMDNQAVHRVTIPRFEGGHVGFTPTVAGDYVFYTRTNVPLTVFLQDGTLVDVKMLNTMIAECAEIKGRHLFTLAKQQYVVRLGPAAGMTTVDLLVMPHMP